MIRGSCDFWLLGGGIDLTGCDRGAGSKVKWRPDVPLILLGFFAVLGGLCYIEWFLALILLFC